MKKLILATFAVASSMASAIGFPVAVTISVPLITGESVVQSEPLEGNGGQVVFVDAGLSDGTGEFASVEGLGGAAVGAEGYLDGEFGSWTAC